MSITTKTDTDETFTLADDGCLTLMTEDGMLRFDADARNYLLSSAITTVAVLAMDCPAHRDRLVSGEDIGCWPSAPGWDAA